MRLLPFLLVCGCVFARLDPIAMQILQRVAHKYQNLDSFVLEGSVVSEGAKFPVLTGYASARVLPEDAPLPFADVKATYPRAPDRFYHFRNAAEEVADAKVLRRERLRAGGQERECDVLSVVYNKTPEPVLYWVERSTSTVWKLEFTDKVRWTMVVEKWTENGELPPWMKGGPLAKPAKEDTRLVGNVAPEITGRMPDGSPFVLSKLRGKVVVLDFWATQCGYCSEEMADLERLRGAVVVGVNQEAPELARKWMAGKKRTLPLVMVEPDTVFNAYKVESLPSTVVIGPDGKVVKQWMEYTRGIRVQRVVDSLMN